MYLHELHYYTTAALWMAIGVTLALTMTWTTRGQRWLVPAVGAGLLAEISPNPGLLPLVLTIHPDARSRKGEAARTRERREHGPAGSGHSW